MKSPISFATRASAFFLMMLLMACAKDRTSSTDNSGNVTLPIDTIFTAKRFAIDAGNNQSVAYHNGNVYVGYTANAQGNTVNVYDYATGARTKQVNGLQLGHCAAMVYNTQDHLLYVANGGGSNPTHVFTVNIEASQPSVQRDYNLEQLGNSAVVALDEANERFYIIAAKSGGDKGDKTITAVDIKTGNIDSANQFTIPFSQLPYVPQGAVYKDGKLYFLLGVNSTVLAVIDLKTKAVTKVLQIPQTPEPEGLALKDDAPSLQFIMMYASKGLYDLNTQ